jgi:hypothetical protein
MKNNIERPRKTIPHQLDQDDVCIHCGGKAKQPSDTQDAESPIREKSEAQESCPMRMSGDW